MTEIFGESYDDFTKKYGDPSSEFKNKMETEFVNISKRWDKWVKEHPENLPNDYSLKDHDLRMKDVNAYDVVQKSYSEYLVKVSDEVANELSNTVTQDDLSGRKQIAIFKNEIISTGYDEVDAFREATNPKDFVSMFANSKNESEFKSKLEKYYADKGLRLHTDLNTDAPFENIRVTGVDPTVDWATKLFGYYYLPNNAEANKSKNLNARADLKTIVYDENWFKTLSEKRDDLYEKGKVSISPLLPSFGKLDKGAGTFTPESSAVMVSTKSPTLPGGQSWYSFMKEFKTMNIDGVNTEISFKGGTVSGTDYFSDMDTDDKMDKIAAAESLINYIYTKGTAEDMKFEMSYNNIAKNEFGKEVMNISVDKDLLDKWGSVDPDKAKIFNDTEYNDILRNGISIIANDGTFKNSLAASSRVSVLEQAVDLAGNKGVTLIDSGNPNNKITFTKDPNLGDYDFNFTLQLGNETKTINKYDSLPLGNTLDQQAENIFSTFNSVNLLSSMMEGDAIKEGSEENALEIINQDLILSQMFNQ
jgi:hypothetical protein